MKISYNDAIDLNNALNSLQGVRKPVHDKEGNVVKDGDAYLIETEPYAISFKARLNSAVAIKLLKPFVQSFSELRNKIVGDARKAALKEDPKVEWTSKHPKHEDMIIELNKLGKQEIDIEFKNAQIKLEDLDISKNKIDPAILAGLMPILIIPKDAKEKTEE